MKIGQLKLTVLMVCLYATGTVFAADKMLAEKSQDLDGCANRCPGVAGEELFMNKVNQSEEQRDHKTFQVGTIVIDASPELVYKTFTDYKRAPEIFSYLKKSKILTNKGQKKTILCEAELAGGLFKFEYVLEFIEHAPNLVEWHRLSGAFKANEGYWKFESIDKGKFTLVTYSKYVDAGFLFPQFIVKKELRDNMPVILGELKHAVEKSAERSPEKVAN